MIFDAPVDILDMRKCSLSSPVPSPAQLTRKASKTVLDAVNSMNSALSDSLSELCNSGPSTPKEASAAPRRPPAPFRRFSSSPQLLSAKKSSSPSVEDATKASTQTLKSLPNALAQRMKLLSDISISLTNLEK